MLKKTFCGGPSYMKQLNPQKTTKEALCNGHYPEKKPSKAPEKALYTGLCPRITQEKTLYIGPWPRKGPYKALCSPRRGYLWGPIRGPVA